MSDGADVSYILNSGVQGTGMLIQGSAVMVKGILHLIQFLNKLHKKGLLTKGEFHSLRQMIKASDGNISYLNIPAENPEYIEQVKEDLKKMNVPFHVLPDLNNGDGMVQVVYNSSYRNVIMPWFQDYCTKRLQDGSFKSERILSALAGEGNTGIITIPTEDNTLLNEMTKDFERMEVSYTLMRDTNVGDGTREVMYAKQDEAKIKSWLENFCQKHVVAGGEKTYQELQNLAGNKTQVGFINIPAENSQTIMRQLKDDFAMLGINYHIMPVQAGSGQTQIMYLKKDEVAVRNWYSSYATDQLIKGGEKSYLDLINLTNGQTQMINIPTNTEMLNDMKADFATLHVNYTIMPDLNVADGMTQIIYASADASKVSAWYEMYQDKLLKETGEVLPEIQSIEMGKYTQTGELTSEEYLNSPQAQAISNNLVVSDVKKNLPDIEKSSNQYSDPIPNIEKTSYEYYDSMPEYEKLTIDPSLIVSIEDETFVSRIPNSQDEYLVCKTNMVCESELPYKLRHQKVYTIFVSKNHRNIIIDSKGNLLPSKSTEELLAHYDDVTRDFGQKQVKELDKLPDVPGKLPKAPKSTTPKI